LLELLYLGIFLVPVLLKLGYLLQQVFVLALCLLHLVLVRGIALFQVLCSLKYLLGLDLVSLEVLQHFGILLI